MSRVSSWTSLPTGCDVPRLTAVTLLVLHDQVGIARPGERELAVLVEQTLHASGPAPLTSQPVIAALAATMRRQMAVAIPPPTGPIPPGMIGEEVGRWADPTHPALTVLGVDPDWPSPLPG